MTSPVATADISMRVTRWLTRFSPPKQIASIPQAMQDDADALLRIFLDHAPDDGWQDWFDDALRRLEAGMTTRSWPAPGEVVRACRGAERPMAKDGTDTRAESATLDLMIDWLHRFGAQMPGAGRPDRTRKLIQRGALRNLREARFKGFVLYPEDEEAARAMLMGREESQRHLAIMAKLWGTSESEADFRLQEGAPMRAPDLGANRISQNFAAE